MFFLVHRSFAPFISSWFTSNIFSIFQFIAFFCMLFFPSPSTLLSRQSYISMESGNWKIPNIVCKCVLFVVLNGILRSLPRSTISPFNRCNLPNTEHREKNVLSFVFYLSFILELRQTLLSECVNVCQLWIAKKKISNRNEKEK